MREILFRGQTRRYGERVRIDGEKVPSNWVYGGVFQGHGDFSIIYGDEVQDASSEYLGKHVVYTDTLGEYTGFTDANGCKIFEDDIIEIHDFNEISYGIVVWDSGAFIVDNYYHKEHLVEHFYEYKVIGNKYDNPELLYLLKMQII